MTVVAALVACRTPAPAAAGEFDPEHIISNDNMRACDSMSQGDPGVSRDPARPLKSLVTTDYAGVKRPASEIISLACRQWSISPKVMLTMLQKEQSLLTRTCWTRTP